MKKLLLIMLASLFMMMSCDILAEEDEESNADYVGTWVDVDGTETDTITFTNSTFEIYIIDTDADYGYEMYIKGSVTVSGDQMTVSTTGISLDGTTWLTEDEVDSSYSDIFEEATSTYSVDGETLTLIDDEDDTTILTKQ